jgi:hypothetical protein
LEKRGSSNDFFSAAYVGADLVAIPSQYHAVGTMRDAIIHGFEDASDEWVERKT